MTEFKTKIPVRIDDINYGGHMGNDRYLIFFQEARLRLLKSLGFSEMNIGNGVSVTQAEAFVRYKAEVFAGDCLEVEVLIDRLSGVRFRVLYRLVRESDKKLVAEGHTLMVGYDYREHKVQKIPQVFKEALEGLKP